MTALSSQTAFGRLSAMVGWRCPWVLALWVVLVLTACGMERESGGAGGDLIPVRVGFSRLRISLPVFVAKEHGFFEAHGLDATLEQYDTAQPLMQALLEGSIDTGGYTALPITYAGMLRSGKPLYFLTTMVEDQEHRISYELRPATPVGQQPAIRSIEDLRGKRIGILPTIAYRAWLGVILQRHGLEPGSDVQIQQVQPTLQPQALASGGVDALFTNDPAATSALAQGVAELISTDVMVPHHVMDPLPFGSFNVSQDWADENPEAFRRLRAALDDAVDFVNNHPSQAKQAMRPYLPDRFQPHVALYPDALYLRSTESSEATFRRIAEIYVDLGVIAEIPDLTDLVVVN